MSRSWRRCSAPALGTADLIVTTGGLGPTEDDITRDAVARAFALPLDIDEPIVDRHPSALRRRGLTMPDINRRQAMVPRGATVLENRNGTAPGLWLERGRHVAFVLLPGPPREMTPMLEAVIAIGSRPGSSGAGLFRRVLRITGRTESDVDARAQPIYSRWTTRPIPIATTILAVLGQIELHLTASRDKPKRGRRRTGGGGRRAAGRRSAPRSTASTAGRSKRSSATCCAERGWTIAAAESCTGGLLTSRLTDVPGSSDYVDRGVVCYSNRAKTSLLDVPAILIAEHGAVSEPVARAMAEGFARSPASDVGIGITGIAGPGGGTPEKPVGTVAIAVADARTTPRVSGRSGSSAAARW